MRLVEKHLRCTLPFLFLLWLSFYFTCCQFLFSSSLHQKFTTRRNGCRESCSGVNWSISARAWANWWRCLQVLYSGISRGESDHKACHLFQQRISSCWRHLSLWSPAWTRQSVQRGQRVTLIGKKWREQFGFFALMNLKARVNTAISRYSQTVSLTDSCLWVL